jgi:uncharacterized repeat protein (TIGR01451 family)
MRHSLQVTPGNAMRWTEDGGVTMNGKELDVHGRRPFSSVLGLAFMLCLTAFGERALFAQAPAPHVRFDQNPPPPIPPDVPAQVLIGEPFTFRVRFNNGLLNGLPPPAPGAITGYGPFIDLVLDASGANMAKPGPCACDGITFVKANMIDVNGGAVPLVSYQSLAPCNPLPPQVPLNHPFAGVQPVQVPAGSQLVTIELPFGSFDPTQPEIVVEVTAFVSPLADQGHPLQISARGGFRYGGTLGPPPGLPVLSDGPNSNLWPPPAQHLSTTPTVMIVSKKYLGPEDETATGPNFIQRYEIALDVANGQTVSNVKVTDHLPINMAYHGMVPMTPGPTTCVLTPLTTPGPNGPFIDVAYLTNDLILQCNPSSITGVLPHDGIHHDAAATFEFVIPELDANHQPVLSPTSCAFVQSVNYITAEGDWSGPTPADACDTYSAPVSSNMTSHPPLQAKCLAIQKTVVDLSGGPPSHPIPGDTLQYTLNFQLSDFKTAGNLKVQDVLSDGQTLVPGSLMLTVTDQCGTTTTTNTAPLTPLPASAWTQTTHLCGPGALPGDPPSFTELDIDVSAAMISLATAAISPPGPFRHKNGILTGGYAFASASTVPANGKITFETTIDDAYQCPVASPHDQYVDKDDPLNNAVILTANILANVGTCSPPTIPGLAGFSAQDASKVEFLIATDFLEKTVYQVQGAAGHPTSCGPIPACPNNPDVDPGDLVTFRLKKTIFSGDAENLTIQDWLPLPTFLVAGGPFIYSVCGLPANGSGCFGPTNNLVTAPTVPTYLPTGATNSITFGYGTFNSPANLPKTIDLLFTRTVTNTPFPDGLYLTNEARECESNTFGVTFCQTAIAQVHVREPALKITKGVVAASNSNAVFSPPGGLVPNGPVPFYAPGTIGRRFNGIINSTNLASTPINSDISSVDANDVVTFAIVVENRGGSLAYDINLADLFPLGSTGAPDCFAPLPGTPLPGTLWVTDGTGANILPFTPAGAFPLNPITLTNPLPGLGSLPAGSNIVVITFDAIIVGDIKPHCCNNTAKVMNYASTQGGPNFVDAGFGGPYQDSAQICVLPKGTKSIKTTSEAHTPGTPPGPAWSPEQLAIGEIIRYHLKVLVPETTSASHYQLQDALPAGLSYLPGPTTIFSPLPPGVSASISPQVTGGSTCGSVGGSPILFDFGNVTNSGPNTSTQEFIELEFNALVCNIASNQNGTALNNSFGVLVDGQQVATSYPAVSAVVVEPKITITKAAAGSPTVNAQATYTITLANVGTATAFDVRLTDPLPGCLTNLTNIQVSTGVTVTNSSTPTRLDLMIASIPVNGTVTVNYSATVSCTDCGWLINIAKVTWTSLPGPLGTIVNSTISSTPGASGLANGERDDSNGYVASATASLCCMPVSNKTINCNPIDGTFTYTFTVTNVSTSPVSGVSFSPPAGVTIAPSSIALSPALLPGHSATVTATIGGPGAVSGASICFNVSLVGQAGVVCSSEQCITLPRCCVSPPSGMIAWYPLDDGVGATTVVEISGNGHNGTPQPGPVGMGGPGSNFPNPPAVVGGSLYFPSSSKWVQVPDTPPLALDIGSGNFTIDAWVLTYIRPAVSRGPIVDKFDATTLTGYRLYLDAPWTAGGATLYFSYGDGTTRTVACIAPIPFQSWHHVAVTVQRSAFAPYLQVLFYVDGTQQGGQSVIVPVGSIANGLDLFIGAFHPPTSGLSEIAIDELELFNRALTQAEIQGIVNARSAGKCKQPDLAITKKAANTPWTVGGTGTFTLLVQNLAPGAAVPAGTVITVTENLPAGLTLTSVSYPSSSWTSCTPSSGAGPLVVGCQYTVPSVGLPAGGSLPLIMFTVKVTAASAAGSFLNCASVQGRLVGGAILQEPTNNDKSCITIPTGSVSPVVLQIPVVLDAAGVSPAHYTSDLVAVNRSGASTQLTVTYYAAPNTSGGVCTVNPPLLLPGKEWRVLDVLAFLRTHGCLSILPSGPLEAGTLQLTFQGVWDPSLVFAGSRATTPNPDANVGGRFGLFLTGIPVGSAPSQSATIFALREDTAYRSNLAIVDFPGSGTAAPTLSLQVMDGATGLASGLPFSYPLGLGEWHQFGSILGSVANGYVTITKIGGGTDRFLAYGVVNDGPASGGHTSDGSLVGTDGAEGLVPIVMSVTSSGFFYTSELVLTNTSATLSIATLTYTPAVTLNGSGGPYTKYVSIGPGQQIRVPDTITWLRDTLLMPLPLSGVNQGDQGGTLLVSGATAYVRTSNPNPNTVVGGTFGLAYPAVPDVGRAWTEAWVYGLVQDSATRTNLAIADARVSDPTTAVTYVVDIYDADTSSPYPVSTQTYSLNGGQWTQVDGILSLAGITHGYVRVSQSSIPQSDYVVYGVLNDGAAPGPPGTSDGSYVPMSGVH